MKSRLEKVLWNYKDVMFALDCKKSKAYEVMKTCRAEYKGAVKHEPSLITRDSVLAYMGSNLARENYIQEIIRKEVRLYEKL